MLKKINLQVNTDPAASAQVLSWFEELNQPPISNKVIWWQCQTVLKEGFDNAVEYAHKSLPPETPILIEAIRFPQRIEIRIWDCGVPFNLEEKLREMPELEENEGSRGRGLRIMQKIADQISYRRTSDDRNCLLIVKSY
ncbi:ATP-binding protein [Leptolyngbya sp. 'hensonii']|uniref:ATP-binding protein n=1 Tax=Leptolyngbya sp. 'hensonii' TaxID=1922337 RepID=UPI00094F6ADC|nr:anti-sigma regulatory factor [Leptolyngbya sp. 'hensonii']OLP16707.1 ATP-binding protein [Leptolyngbya sp. 'hensonii']